MEAKAVVFCWFCFMSSQVKTSPVSRRKPPLLHPCKSLLF